MGLFYALSLAINTLVEHRNKGDDESLRQTTFAVQIIGWFFATTRSYSLDFRMSFNILSLFFFKYNPNYQDWRKVMYLQVVKEPTTKRMQQTPFC